MHNYIKEKHCFCQNLKIYAQNRSRTPNRCTTHHLPTDQVFSRPIAILMLYNQLLEFKNDLNLLPCTGQSIFPWFRA